MKDMTAIISEVVEKASEPGVRTNARRARSLRNARARKKLEALREEKELQQQLADVWSEPDHGGLTMNPDESDEAFCSPLAA